MVRVADRGLREGVLMDLMRQADREADPFFRRPDDMEIQASRDRTRAPPCA